MHSCARISLNFESVRGQQDLSCRTLSPSVHMAFKVPNRGTRKAEHSWSIRICAVCNFIYPENWVQLIHRGKKQQHQLSIICYNELQQAARSGIGKNKDLRLNLG